MKGNYFDQIAGVVKLDSRVSVYVPSTTGTDKLTDNRAQVEKVAAKLAAMFGGATATEARGYWCSQSAGLVGEGVTIVYSAATPEAVQEHAAEVVRLCQQIKQDMQQEGVSLDVDGTLYII